MEGVSLCIWHESTRVQGRSPGNFSKPEISQLWLFIKRKPECHFFSSIDKVGIAHCVQVFRGLLSLAE